MAIDTLSAYVEELEAFMSSEGVALSEDKKKGPEKPKEKPKPKAFKKAPDAAEGKTWEELTGAKPFPTIPLSETYRFKTYVDEDWEERQLSRIPPLEKFKHVIHTEQMFHAFVLLDRRITSMFWGGAGTGKDFAAEYYAAVTHQPYYRVTGNRDRTPDTFIARPDISGTSTTMLELDAVEHCEYGGVFALSEPAALFPESLFAFQPTWERGGYLEIADHVNPVRRRIPVCEKARYVLTSNVRGYGDGKDLYASTNQMDSSSLNRILSYMQFRPMLADQEEALLLNHVPSLSRDYAKRMVKLSVKLRELHEQRKIEAEWSMRSLIAWAEMSEVYGDVGIGFKTTFWDKLSDDEGREEKALVRRFWDDIDFFGSRL